MTVKARLTRRRERETPEYCAMMRRMLRAHGRRVGDADPEDDRLVELAAQLHELGQVAVAVQGQRRNGFSWAAIGRGLGVTRQAAQMTWGPHVEQLEHAETRAMLREWAAG